MRRIPLLWLCVVLVAFVIGCGPKMVTVQSGEKTICSECEKVLYSDIQTRTVPVAESAKFSVREVRDFCPECRAKLDAKAQQKSANRVEGTWTVSFGWMGTEVLDIKAGQPIEFKHPPGKVSWEPTSDGFKGTATWEEYGKVYQRAISGRVISGGSQLIIDGWGTSGFNNEQTIFNRG